MFFHPDEQEEKEDALSRLKDVMMQGMGERFGKMKRPVSASMTIEKAPDDEMEEKLEEALEDRGHDDGDSEDDNDDKEDIEQLLEAGRHHMKFCKGGMV